MLKSKLVEQQQQHSSQLTKPSILLRQLIVLLHHFETLISFYKHAINLIIPLQARNVTGNFEKRAPQIFGMLDWQKAESSPVVFWVRSGCHRSCFFSIYINHKGLQRTANEYAEERRIYKDLISKTNECRHIKFCKQKTAMLKIRVRRYFSSEFSLIVASY